MKLKQTIIAGTCCLFVILLPTPAFSEVNVSADPGSSVTINDSAHRKIASDALRNWLDDMSAIFTKKEAKHLILGISDASAYRDISLGYGFAVKSIDSKVILDGGAIEKALKFDGDVRYMVMLNNKAVGLLSMRTIDGQYRMSGIGSKELAERVLKVTSAYKRNNFYLARSHDAIMDFVVIEDPVNKPKGEGGGNLYFPLEFSGANDQNIQSGFRGKVGIENALSGVAVENMIRTTLGSFRK
jgi:hypothetical protein